MNHGVKHWETPALITKCLVIWFLIEHQHGFPRFEAKNNPLHGATSRNFNKIFDGLGIR
jgi:hypothetical protein